MTEAAAKSLKENENANGMKTGPLTDHWSQVQDGVPIRNHLVIRTNLYLPDLEDPVLRRKRIKSVRTTYVRYLNGQNDVINDRWDQPDNTRTMPAWVGQTILFVNNTAESHHE